ncbi:MAG: chorismate mutase [Candidatus Syntrophoarchaeum sp.]|nr:chorismate mutase [Candidatus Syntrophoarchaeum sp.]
MSAEESKLGEIRKRIDEIDDAIADLLSKRRQCATEAKEEKLRLKKPLRDRQREKEVVEKWCARASRSGSRSRGGDKQGLSEEMMKKMAELIIEYTVKNEMEE